MIDTCHYTEKSCGYCGAYDHITKNHRRIIAREKLREKKGKALQKKIKKFESELKRLKKRYIWLLRKSL